MHRTIIFVLLLTLSVLAGCGNKAALTLPAPTQASLTEP